MCSSIHERQSIKEIGRVKMCVQEKTPLMKIERNGDGFERAGKMRYPRMKSAAATVAIIVSCVYCVMCSVTCTS